MAAVDPYVIIWAMRKWWRTHCSRSLLHWKLGCLSAFASKVNQLRVVSTDIKTPWKGHQDILEIFQYQSATKKWWSKFGNCLCILANKIFASKLAFWDDFDNFRPVNSGSFCKNFAHFLGNFWELQNVKKVKKWI